MKTVRIILSILLTLVMVLSLGASAFAETGLQVSLGDQIGTLESGSRHFTFQPKDGDKRVLLDRFGINQLGRSFDDVTSFGYEEGIYIVADYSQLPNYLSLVNVDGTVYVENAALIRGSNDYRYAEVSVATEKVETKEECFLFSYEPQGAIDVRLSPGESDTMYAGYTMIYDIAEKHFVGDLRIDSAADSINYVGNNILIARRGGNDRTNELYRPDGSLLGHTEDLYTYGDFFVRSNEDYTQWSVLDENLNQLYVLDFRPHEVFDGGVFVRDLEEGYQLVDATGTPISELIFWYSPSKEGQLVYDENSDGNYAVVTMTGKTILDFSAGAEDIYKAPYGFLEISYRDGSYGLVYPDGTLVKLESEPFGVLSDLYADQAFILDKMAYQSVDGSVNALGIYGPANLVFVVENEDKQCGLYSVVDGQELLPISYDIIQYYNGCIYANNGSDFEIYPLIVNG